MNEGFDPALVKQLTVSIGDASRITGVPIRKIRYWEEKGIISSVCYQEKGNKKYDYLAVKKIILIQELLEEGFTLEKATEKVNIRLNNTERAYREIENLNRHDDE